MPLPLVVVPQDVVPEVPPAGQWEEAPVLRRQLERILHLTDHALQIDQCNQICIMAFDLYFGFSRFLPSVAAIEQLSCNEITFLPAGFP